MRIIYVAKVYNTRKNYFFIFYLLLFICVVLFSSNILGNVPLHHLNTNAHLSFKTTLYELMSTA